MPQITSELLPVPVLIDVLDDQINYAGPQMYRFTRNGIDCDKETNLLAENCDKFNQIDNVVAINDVGNNLLPDNIQNNIGQHLPINCDTNIKYEIASGTKPISTYLCHRCKVVFNSRVTFEQHYKQAYNDRPIYTCQICEKQMKNKRSYQRHYNRHAISQKFTCSICSKNFTQERILKKHQLVHNVTIAKSCTECKEEFFDLIKFKAHRRTHAQTKSPQNFQCNDCGKLMKNRSSLNMHSKIHSNDRQYGCMICDQKFVQKINLINHVKVHNTIKTHSCGECGKSFVGQSQLIRHNIQHTNVRSFECETCKKMYKTKRDLKLHLMVHAVQRPHKCSTCDKTFLSTSKLKQHLNIHSGDRPFKCNFCPKDFTNFPNWLKHTRRRHKVDHKTGEKLVVMPNFLSKSNKSNKNLSKTGETTKTTATDKRTVKPTTATTTDKPIIIAANSTIKTMKCEPELIINCEMTDENGLFNDILLNQTDLTEASASNEENETPLPKLNSISDISTITVNNRTLPLNTSDDLERAASLLMHQTLDYEDDIEYVNVKSEPFEALNFECNQSQLQSQTQPQTQTHHIDNKHAQTSQFHDYQLETDIDFQSNYRLMSPNELDFIYSYYPQSTQCDFTMMPLPPINTVKSKLKAVDSSSTIFTSMANVL